MEAEHRAAEPAATVVPIRDGEHGLEVLMLRRNAKGTFAGMWVFPGGRVDPADHDASGDDAGAARRAATREALEEADLVFDPADLLPYSHWTPPEGPGRRFPTWFFLAAVREAVEITVDGREIHEHAWVSPTEAIRRRDAGEVQLAPPTWMTLNELGRMAGVDEALSTVASREPERFATHISTDGDLMVAMWRGDAAYDTGVLDAPGGRRRLIMDPAGWRLEERSR